MVRPPSGTVTFLFTAIEGSAAPGGGSTTEARERHDLAVRNAAEGHGGYVFRMGGDDSSATAFPAAGSALEAALEVQRALSNEDGGGFQVRMAVHTGVAGESDGDYVGPPLSRVAGLLAAGHGGQILISAVTHGLVKDTLEQLAPGARLRYLGEHRVGALGHTEGIFQLVVPDLPDDFPRSGRMVSSIPYLPATHHNPKGSPTRRSATRYSVMVDTSAGGFWAEEAWLTSTWPVTGC